MPYCEHGYITEDYGNDGEYIYECSHCNGTGKGTLKDINIFELDEKCRRLELPIGKVLEAYRQQKNKQKG